MITLGTLLMICALVCFVLVTIGVSARINLLALGFVFWTLAILIGGYSVFHK